MALSVLLNWRFSSIPISFLGSITPLTTFISSYPHPSLVDTNISTDTLPSTTTILAARAVNTLERPTRTARGPTSQKAVFAAVKRFLASGLSRLAQHRDYEPRARRRSRLLPRGAVAEHRQHDAHHAAPRER